VAVEALTRACVAPGAKVLKDSTPRSVRLGTRIVKAGASRVVPQIQDRMRTSSDATAIQQATEIPSAGWYADPAERFDYRYWDGHQWTDHVSRKGSAEIDSLEPRPDS
jgi:hypothetical protein